MKSKIKISTVVLLIASLLFSCSKDDNDPVVENEKGYFPTQISTNDFERPGLNATYNISYNEHNEITKIEQVAGTDTYASTFTYTNHLLTEASLNNGAVIYTINYTTANKVASISEGGTDIVFTYDEANNKYSWVAGSNTGYADFNENNAIETMYTSYNISISTSTEKDGVFKNLTFLPALSLVMGVFALTKYEFYFLSPATITGYISESSVDTDAYTVENTRNDNGNIVSATYIYSDGTPREELTITYEKREINP